MSADEPPRKPPRPGSVVEVPPRRAGTQGDRDKRRDHHSRPHGIPVTTFAMPPMPQEQPYEPESWDSGRDAYTPVHSPPAQPTLAQQVTAIDTNVRKAAGASISTLGLLEELRRANSRLELQNSSTQKMLADVIEEKRRAQAVIEQMAIGAHASTLKDADLSRTIKGKVWIALIALISAVAYWIGKGAPLP